VGGVAGRGNGFTRFAVRSIPAPLEGPQRGAPDCATNAGVTLGDCRKLDELLREGVDAARFPFAFWGRRAF
jgi:hypothetical protein